MASAVAPPTTPKATTSVDPLYTQALEQAKAALAAETAPVQAEQNASDAQYQARQGDATANAAAVSNLLKGIGPAVNSEYQTGAQNMELAANGFSQGMQDALQGNTNNLNSMLQKLGSPAQLDSHASQAGDVLYALHGYNPGTMFSQQGANLGAAADLQAGAAALKGQENVKDLQNKAITADQGFQAKIAEMAGNLPGDTEKNYQTLQTIALNDAKFREQVKNDNANQAYKAATLKLALAKYSLDKAKYKTSIDEFNAKQSQQFGEFTAKQSQQQAQFNARQAQQLSIASARLAQQKYISDRSYGLSLAKLGIEQAKLQQTIVSNSFKAANGGLTKAQVTKFNSVAESIAMSSYYGASKVTTVNGVPKQTSGVGAVTYAEALQRELSKGMPVQMALDALDRVYPPEQRPTDEILAQVLGPLDPALVQSVAAQAKALNDASTNMSNSVTDPMSTLFPRTAVGAKIAQTALSQLGTPYQYGGPAKLGSRTDCSGLLQAAAAANGVHIGRTTYEQWKQGIPVPLNQLQPGDAVFFEMGKAGPGHVAIYIGNGRVVEDPHTGASVEISQLAGRGAVGARRYG